jgi:hypothetical protein
MPEVLLGSDGHQQKARKELTMNRNVYKVAPPAADAAEPKEPKPSEKLVKYFPAEAFALYSALDPAVRTTFGGVALKIALWASLAIAIVFCVMFLRRFWNVQRRDLVAISCGALVLYVAALGGPFTTTSPPLAPIPFS